MAGSGRLVDYLGYGTAASRPASVTPVTGGLALWYSYDTTAVSIWNTNTSAWVSFPGGSGSGTVTSVSVVSANGFAGTVATATTTPAITLETTVTGILYGNGTGVAAATAANFPAGITQTIASGTAALGTTAIASGAKATTVTVAATGVATTDVIDYNFNGDPTAVTGYTPSASGVLTIIAYPTANNVNFIVSNNTSASITPGAITLNWRVLR